VRCQLQALVRPRRARCPLFIEQALGPSLVSVFLNLCCIIQAILFDASWDSSGPCRSCKQEAQSYTDDPKHNGEDGEGL